MNADFGRFVAKKRPEAWARFRLRRMVRRLYKRFLHAGADLVFDQSETNELTIVVVVFNQPDLLYATLQTLRDQNEPCFELVVVDNGSDRETRELLSRIKGARIVCNERNEGFVVAANQGGAEGHAPYLLHLNSDVMFLSPVLKRGLARMTSEPELGVLGGQILLPSGVLQEAGGRILEDGRTLGIGRLDRPGDPRYASAGDVDYVSAAFMMTPRHVWEDTGGFDAGFSPGYYEDVDYCCRVKKAGRRVFYDPNVKLLHFEHGSSSKKSALSLMDRNHDLFMSKHADLVAKPG